MNAIPNEVAGRFRSDVVLKRDVFSTVERGVFLSERGEVAAVLRRIDQVPWWSSALARLLFARERHALSVAQPLAVAPPLLFAGRQALVRGWIDGVALHIAKPYGDRGYFRSAKAALHALHRARICHNDLAKEQNWLRTPDGRAIVTDFQLAVCFKRRHLLFRVAAYEDIRHLLKHKRRYLPDALTASERRILARKSLPTRIWMATGKRVYYAVTRGLFRFVDREGGGARLVRDAPIIVARLKSHPSVREAVVVAFPDRRAGTGLYAFAEGGNVSEQSLRDYLAAPGLPRPPERLQVAEQLPRRANGDVHTEILQLLAMNQIDLIDPLIGSESERATVARMVADRRNLRDRFAF
jgi:predicted Ser/Thr protein kinase